MSRENKRKRDERRFGKPELFFDDLTSREWSVPKHLEHLGDSIYPLLQEDYGKLKQLVLDSTVIQCRNVCDYFMAESGSEGAFKNGFDVSRNLPGFRPQFKSMFLDCSCSTSLPYIPPRWGILLQSYEGKPGDVPTVLGWMFLNTPSGNMAPIIIFNVNLDENWVAQDIGPILYRPLPLIGLNWNKETRDHEITDPLYRHMCSLLPMGLLAVCFMNCKNVTIQPHDPDRQINRERRRANLKPFVRFHTINIEPMKSVLRTEGDIEHNGLKRALHICRGHFATYTDRMFGRKLDKPVTVFREAHVRGSAKEGLVISDYRVNAPKTEGGPK